MAAGLPGVVGAGSAGTGIGGLPAVLAPALALVLAFAALVAERTMRATPAAALPEAPALRRLLMLPVLLLPLAALLDLLRLWGLPGGVPVPAWPAALAAAAMLPVLAELGARAAGRWFVPAPEDARATAAVDCVLLALAGGAVVSGGLSAPVRSHFGLDFSRSWALGFLRRAAMPAGLLTAALCWGLSGVSVLPADRRGVYERLGVPVAVWGPGLHLALPWPLGRVRPVELGTMHVASLGASPGETGAAAGGADAGGMAGAAGDAAMPAGMALPGAMIPGPGAGMAPPGASPASGMMAGGVLPGLPLGGGPHGMTPLDAMPPGMAPAGPGATAFLAGGPAPGMAAAGAGTGLGAGDMVPSGALASGGPAGGVMGDPEGPAPLSADRLWDAPHPGEAEYLVASPGLGGQGFQAVSADLRVLWRVGPTAAQARDFLYGAADPDATVRADAARLATRFFAARTLDALLGAEGRDAAGRLEAALSAELARAGTGIEVVAVVVEAIHPPVGAAAAYHAVQAAEITARTAVAAERGRAHGIASGAREEAHRVLDMSRATAGEGVAAARADAARFAADREAMAAGGQAFLLERQLSALSAAAARVPLTVVDHRLTGAQAPVIDLRRLVVTAPGTTPQDPD